MASRIAGIPEIGRTLTKPARARQGWIDVLRGLAILLIISLHASVIIELFGRKAWAPAVKFNDLFAPYRMPLLMLLSGLLVEDSLRKGPLLYFEGKFRNIAYPYIL
jgi:fucose 4-O-acetylase-like acetyltransferase